MPSLKNELIESFKYSFRLVHKSTGFYAWASFIPAAFGSILPLVTVYLLKFVIDETIVATATPDDPEAFRRVAIWIIITGLIFLIGYIKDAFEKYIKDAREQVFFDYIYKRVHEKTTRIELKYFDDSKYYDLFSRALENAQVRPIRVFGSIISVFQNTIALITLSVLLLSLHKSIFLVLIVATVPLGLAKLKSSRELFHWNKKITKTNRKTWDINDVLTKEHYAPEIRLFSLKDFFIRLFCTLRTGMREGFLKIYKKRMLFEIGAQFIAAFAVFGAFWVICYQAFQGALTIGALTMYIIALQKGVGMFNSIFHDIASLYENSLYVGYLKRFLSIPDSKDEKHKKEAFPKTLRQSIEFRNVSFKYPNSKRHVLENVNLKIKAGSTVALVGPNGAGKTTIIKLMCGFFDADSGQILFDGVDIKRINPKSLRENISAIFQNFAKYNFTASENIKFGDAAVDRGREVIEEAAKKARVHSLIKSLPDGYNTILGKIYDDSEELSIGQWQKISLARAFYKNSQIVILDEPSSAMDPEAEFELFSIFKEIMVNRTGILVSHRFSTVQMADYIYVLDKDSVVEEGTHKELLEKKGVYAHMFNRQAMYYK